jgi:hypothetical protein
VGGGPEGNQQGGVCEDLLVVVRVVRKVYSHWRKLCLEIVKNKFPSNYHCLLFINTFRYHLDFTSYFWNTVFAHFAFLFQPEQMCFPFILHGSANLILFEKNYYVLMKTYKNFQIFCFLTMEVRSKMRKGYRRRNGNQTAL